MLSWFYLVLAAIAETLFGIGMFHSRGFTVLWPSIYGAVCGTATAVLLAFAMKGLPIGLAIVVWSGLATIATAAYGIVYLGEPRDLVRLGFMALILGGAAGLKFTSAH